MVRKHPEIWAKMIKDSISPEGVRLSTIQFRQPRMVHADFMTHRKLSRNARSSRAVPVVTLLAEAANPYVPHFMKNKPGMSASEEFSPEEFAQVEEVWREMAEHTRQGVIKLNALGLHKQWANRPLEWFGYIDVLVSATSFSNYSILRREGNGAQPEIEMVESCIYDALEGSTPEELKPGQWHMPYIEQEDWKTAEDYLTAGGVLRKVPTAQEVIDVLIKVSAARCARLTIRPFDGNADFPAELERYKKLIVSQPVHASPTEHQATPDFAYKGSKKGVKYHRPDLHGNFDGWRQHRKMIPNENVTVMVPKG